MRSCRPSQVEHNIEKDMERLITMERINEMSEATQMAINALAAALDNLGDCLEHDIDECNAYLSSVEELEDVDIDDPAYADQPESWFSSPEGRRWVLWLGRLEVNLEQVNDWIDEVSNIEPVFYNTEDNSPPKSEERLTAEANLAKWDAEHKWVARG